MAYTTIDDPSAHFTITLYTGSSNTGHEVTNSANAGNFKPDWLWIKNRSGTHGTRSHELMDSNRGANKALEADDTEAEFTRSGTNSFNTNGFTVGDDLGVNSSASPSVAWQWKANGGTTSSNTDGGITSTVQVNSTAGFSIVTWTGNGSQTNIGHGLGTTPEMIWIKNRSDNENWWVGCSAAGTIADGKHLNLNLSNSLQTNNTSFVNANPTSTVFDVGGSSSTDNLINGSSDNMLAYCFHSVKGYSKIGSYTGNGNTDGAFVYTGFRPALVICKKTSAAENWNMTDSKRSPFNVCQAGLSPSTNAAEDTTNGVRIDLLSNGFKARDTAGQYNDSGASYIYMAFAEHPFVSSKGVPTTAR